MSTSDGFSVRLQSIQKSLYCFGGPILMLIGTVSCIINIIIFNKKNLRRSPCSICLIAFNTVSFLLLYLSFLPAILQIGYNIEPGAYNLIYCRLRYYLGFLLACLPPFYLVLASIDRTLVTSLNARMRQLSNRYFMYKCVFIVTLFWILFHIHALIYTTILQYGPNYFICYFQPGLYTVLVSYYTLIVNGIIPLILLSIFGILTIKNMHGTPVRNLIATRSINQGKIRNNIKIFYRKDQQLIRMLLIEILTCIIFNFIHPTVLLYSQITQNQMKSEKLTAIELFLISISTLSVHIPYCTSLYTNLIVSKSFRRETKKILFKIVSLLLFVHFNFFLSIKVLISKMTYSFTHSLLRYPKKNLFQ